MIEVLAGVGFGFVLAITLNRIRWDLFPLSGGGSALRWMGGPDEPPRTAVALTAPIDVPCEHCGAPPGTTCEHDNGAAHTIGVRCAICDSIFFARPDDSVFSTRPDGSIGVPVCWRCRGLVE